jgi:hypothetical protein
MGEDAPNHSVICEDARRYGVRLAEQLIEEYGLENAEEAVDQALAAVRRDIRQQVGNLRSEGLPHQLAILWGHESVNGLQDRLLEHVSFLRMATKLVHLDPVKAAGK